MKKLLLLTFFFLLVASCCNKQSTESYRYTLTDEQKQLIPYQAGQDISFEYSNGTEINFHVSQREINLESMGAEHCGDPYFSFEKLNVEMYSESPYMIFNLEIQAQEFEENYLHISFNTHQAFFQFDMDSAPDFPSIEIDGTTFENVYISENQVDNPSIIVPETIFYNKTDGIIQIILTDNETISLKK